MRRGALIAAVLLLAGCGASDRADTSARPAQPPPPPDAGTSAGHANDRAEVEVPERESTPPSAVVMLSDSGGRTLGRASMPGDPPEAVVSLATPRFTATTTGTDRESGIARVRVSLQETFTCRDASGREFSDGRVRYYPAPQIERIKTAPGARLPVADDRKVAITVSGAGCRGGELLRGTGEVWGEAVNGTGLEAVTHHVRFTYAP